MEQKEMTNNELAKFILGHVDERLDKFEVSFVTKEEFREAIALLAKEMREGFERLDKRFDFLELNHGQRLARVGGRLIVVKDVIQDKLGAKVSWM